MTVEQLVKIVRASKKKHRYIYHFTDRSNLTSIRRQGLLSKAQQPGRMIFPRYTGGDTVSKATDIARGIYDDVSMCLTLGHPLAYKCRMQGRHPDQIFLGYDPEILLLPNVRIALGLANASETTILPIKDALSKLDLEILYGWVDDRSAFIERMNVANKYEVLVPNIVPSKYLKSID